MSALFFTLKNNMLHCNCLKGKVNKTATTFLLKFEVFALFDSR